MSITAQQLREILAGAGFPAWLWQFPDETYETVSRPWVIDNWRAWLESRPPELVVWGDAGGKRVRLRPLWKPNSRDCDNLAFGTTAHAHEGNALAAVLRNQIRGGLAYSFLFYQAAPARPENFNIEGGHSINWFVDHDHSVGLFEPGMGEFVEFNTPERSSSWFGMAA